MRECEKPTYTTTLYMWEFDDLFVGRIYSHTVYAGIWWFVCRPHIQLHCISGPYVLSAMFFFLKVQSIYKHGPCMHLDCISGSDMFWILSGYVFFPKYHMLFFWKFICFWHIGVRFISPRIQLDSIRVRSATTENSRIVNFSANLCRSGVPVLLPLRWTSQSGSNFDFVPAFSWPKSRTKHGESVTNPFHT